MINKIVHSVDEALADVKDGSTVLIGGFGTAGIPTELIDGLIAQGARELTVVINNAGNGDTGLAALLKAGRVQADIDLKLFAAIRLTRLAWPGMKARRWGRVINVLNTYAKAPGAGTAPTSVTRAAGMAYTKVLSHELAPFNVLVNAVCIGRIESEQWPRFHQADAPELSYTEYLAREGRKIPLGRLGKAEEFAALVCLLASEGGGYITGTAINIDGGASPAD